MAMILATWELGLRYGHIGHLAPVARALTARGHSTTLASRDVVIAHSAPGEPFARILQAPVYPRAAPRRPTLTYSQAIADGGFADAEGLAALVRAWLALLDLIEPAAVLAEHAPASLLAARIAGVPAARIGTAFAAPPASRPMPSLMPWLADDPAARAAADAGADATIRDVCARLGVPPPDGVTGLLAGAQDYVVSWPELDHYGGREGGFYYGPMEGLGGRARPGWPAGDGPRVLVYLPFDHPAAPALADALGSLGWPAVWHSQRPPDAPLPPTIAFAAEPLDMAHMLGEAAIFAGRAGHGSCADALKAGCASLAMPDTLESAMIGYRLVQARLGLLPPAEPGAAALSATLEQLAGDPRIGAATAAAKARYVGYDARAAAEELTDDLLADFGLT